MVIKYSKRTKVKQLLRLVGVLVFLFISYKFWTLRSFNSGTNSERRVLSNTLSVQAKWQIFLQDSITSPLKAGNNLLIFGTNQDRILALEKDTGTVLWEHGTFPSYVGDDYYEIAHDQIVVASGKNKIVSLSTLSGMIHWERILPYDFTETPDMLIVDDKYLVLGGAGHGSRVLVYLLENGEFVWDLSQSFIPRGYSRLFECTSEGILKKYIEPLACVQIAGNVFVIEVENGIVNRLPDLPETINIEHFFGGDFLILPPRRVSFAIVDAINSEVFQLPYSCPYTGNPPHPPFFLYPKILFVTGCSDMYFMNQEYRLEDPEWIIKPEEKVISSLVSINGKVGYFLTDNNQLKGINLENGREIGTIEFSSSIEKDGSQFADIFTDSSNLYVLLDFKNLFVFEETP